MNNPMQILEPSSLFPPDTQGVVNKGQREDGESSFSSILSQNKGEPSGTEGGQSLHTSGKKLPEQQDRVDNQQDAADGSPATMEQTDASWKPDVAMDLPEQQAVQTFQQQALPDVLAIEETGFVNAAGVAEQLLNADKSALVRTTGQQVQLQGQVVDVRILAKTVPGNQPLSKDHVQQDSVHDVSGVRGLPASYLVAAETGRLSSDMEPAVNAVREAVQLAIANHASNGDLKQFLQQKGNHQAASNILPASNSAETNAAPFLQTLSDSALTMPSARVQVPVGQPGWGEAVGKQVAWFVSQKISAASLRLNPQHLGPMEIAVSMDGDQASVSFTSQQAIVRDALESSIPRLREMLAENGLNLINVNVSQQGKSHGNGQGAPGSQQEAGVANDESGANEPTSGLGVRQITTLTQGLVDFYA